MHLKCFLPYGRDGARLSIKPVWRTDRHQSRFLFTAAFTSPVRGEPVEPWGGLLRDVLALPLVVVI